MPTDEPSTSTHKSPERRNAEPPPWRVEGRREHPARHAAGGGFPGGRWFIAAVLLMLAVNFAVATRVTRDHQRATVPYSFFRAQADADRIAEISSRGDTIQGRFRTNLRVPSGGKTRTTHLFKTQRPAFADDRVLAQLLRNKVIVNAKPVEGGSIVSTLLFGFGPTILFVVLFVFLLRRMSRQGSGGLLGAMGKSKARRYEASEQRTTFADVAGIDEAKDELAEVVGFLKDPDRYRRLGGMIPRGVLLSGLPGTGKTLLARAVAGEAHVPFFSLSASEFVEMIVGVGASRVRDLFQEAKKAAPAIIFVDELDAIGRARGAGGLTGANDEREQTLNQILTEMDGFDGTEGVIVLAATNRPEILDPALLRAGRFDRRVVVNPPDLDGREKILRVHTRSVPVDDTVDLSAIAATTPGMVGADLRNLVNEAALHAARRNADRVGHEDFTNAMEKVLLGTARRIVLPAHERRRTAVHESGHALIGMLHPGADPVRKVSIIPRGNALGVTFQSPGADRYGYSRSYLRGRIVGALGGRAAEELVYGEVTTGAESDLEQATALARQMVGRWGMSEKVGLVSVLPRAGQETVPWIQTASERTQELVDDEVRSIIDGCYTDARAILAEHREQLQQLTDALLEHETLDEADAYAAAAVAQPVAAAE